MKIKFLLLAACSMLSASTGFAQSLSRTSCLSEKSSQEISAQFPDQETKKALIEQQIQNYIAQKQNQRQAAGVVIKIPVVIHVVTQTGCNGISKEQILNGLEVLNKDFRRQNADTVNTRAIFKPVAADTEIEFVLARKNPFGGHTEGINRVTSPTANGPINRDDVKIAAPAWPTDKYFNIWLVENIYDAQVGANVLGYAYFPSVLSTIPDKFGVVLAHTAWGEQGGVPGSTANTNGHYATHEISHCLNLSHIFDGDVINGVVQCTLPNGACGFGDGVADTPPSYPVATSPTCDFTQNTCHNDVACSSFTTDVPDMVENFQYLSDDNCQNMFTNGQKMRMQASLNTIPHLQNLISPVNAAFTGIDNNPTSGVNLGNPIPYFCATNTRICEGNSITFTDKSYNAPVTTWSWTFPGGTPATSSAPNPVVTYNTPGKYDVSLTVTNPNGQQTTFLQNHITVVPTSNLINVSPGNIYVEGFEEPTFPVSTTSNRTWEKTTSSLATNPENWTRVSNAYSIYSNFGGTNSLRLQNANLPAGTVSTLITPNFFASGGPGHIYLAIAYAKRTAQPTEKLQVFYSNDCGVTWNGPIKNLIGNQLVTNGGTQVNNFVPTANEWQMVEISQSALQYFANGQIAMFKIEVTSNGGGNLYIDNFNMGTVLGTKEIKNAHNIQLYPNPLTAETGIHFELKTPETGKLKVFDVLGNEVFAGQETTFSAGKHSVLLGKKQLSSGVYMVQLNLGGQLYNTKLLVP